jgi:hypothetical protein
VLDATLPLAREITRVSIPEWVAQQNAQGRLCACGCGAPVVVRPHHRRIGIPKFIHGHHRQVVTDEVTALHQAGLLTAQEVADQLGVCVSTVRRLDRESQAPAARHGKHGLRGFTPERVEVLRAILDGPRGAKMRRRVGSKAETGRRR